MLINLNAIIHVTVPLFEYKLSGPVVQHIEMPTCESVDATGTILQELK